MAHASTLKERYSAGSSTRWAAMDYLTAELERRIGKQNVQNLFKSLTTEWGEPLNGDQTV